MIPPPATNDTTCSFLKIFELGEQVIYCPLSMTQYLRDPYKSPQRHLRKLRSALYYHVGKREVVTEKIAFYSFAD